MKIEIDFPDDVFVQAAENKIKDALSREVDNFIRTLVNKKISQYQNQIEQAVTVHLEKRLTDERIRQHIDTSVAQIVKQRIEEID